MRRSWWLVLVVVAFGSGAAAQGALADDAPPPATARFPDVGVPPPSATFAPVPGTPARRPSAEELLAANPYSAELAQMAPIDREGHPYAGDVGNPYTDDLRLVNPFSPADTAAADEDPALVDPYRPVLAARGVAAPGPARLASRGEVRRSADAPNLDNPYR